MAAPAPFRPSPLASPTSPRAAAILFFALLFISRAPTAEPKSSGHQQTQNGFKYTSFCRRYVDDVHANKPGIQHVYGSIGSWCLRTKTTIVNASYFTLKLDVDPAVAQKNTPDKTVATSSWVLKAAGKEAIGFRLRAEVSGNLCESVRATSLLFRLSPEWAFDLCAGQESAKVNKEGERCVYLETSGPEMEIVMTPKPSTACWSPDDLNSKFNASFRGHLEIVGRPSGNPRPTSPAAPAISFRKGENEFCSYVTAWFKPNNRGVPAEERERRMCFDAGYSTGKMAADGKCDVFRGADPCRPGGICFPDPSSDVGYGCLCQPGFFSAVDGASCHDVDECSVALPPESRQICPDFAVCSNTVGSYECACLPGRVAKPVPGKSSRKPSASKWNETVCEKRSTTGCGEQLDGGKNVIRAAYSRWTPVKWIGNPDIAHDDLCYHQPRKNKKLTWLEAAEYCEGIGGRLACGSLEDLDAEQLRFLGSNFKGFSWIGLTQKGDGAKVRCADVRRYGNFGNHRLDDEEQQHKCMILAEPFYWTHFDCNDKLRPLCELSLSRHNFANEMVECPQGWRSSEDVPNSCYMWGSRTAVTFDEALEICRNVTLDLKVDVSDLSSDQQVPVVSRLVTIESKEENQFVGETFKTMTWVGIEARIPRKIPVTHGRGSSAAPGKSATATTADLASKDAASTALLDLDWRTTADGSRAEYLPFAGKLSFGRFVENPVDDGSVRVCAAMFPSNMVDEDCSQEFNVICEKDAA